MSSRGSSTSRQCRQRQSQSDIMISISTQRHPQRQHCSSSGSKSCNKGEAALAAGLACISVAVEPPAMLTVLCSSSAVNQSESQVWTVCTWKLH